MTTRIIKLSRNLKIQTGSLVTEMTGKGAVKSGTTLVKIRFPFTDKPQESMKVWNAIMLTENFI